MKILEFAGTISAGKMGILGALKSKIREEYGLVTGGIVEDVRIRFETAHPENYLERQILTTNRVMTRLLELKDFGGPDLLLVHRGLWDATAFTQAYVQDNLCPPERAGPWIVSWRVAAHSLIDKLVLVKIPVKVAWQRMQKRFPQEVQKREPDPVFTERFLGILDSQYQNLEEQLEEAIPDRLMVIDGSRPVEENTERLIEAISQLLLKPGEELSETRSPFMVGKMISKKEDMRWGTGTGKNHKWFKKMFAFG